MNCNRKRRVYHRGITCFSKKALVEVAQSLEIRKANSKNRSQLLEEISEEDPMLNNDKAILRKLKELNITENVYSQFFAPAVPGEEKKRVSGESWYSSTIIDAILYDYTQDNRRRFASISNLHSISDTIFSRAKNRVKTQNPTRFATVGNTSLGSGTHWVAVFAQRNNTRKNVSVEYYDSFGNIPNTQTSLQMIDRTVSIAKSLVPKSFTITVTNVIDRDNRHQRDATSCGPLALWFIEMKLSGKSASWIRNNPPNIETCRNNHKEALNTASPLPQNTDDDIIIV